MVMARKASWCCLAVAGLDGLLGTLLSIAVLKTAPEFALVGHVARAREQRFHIFHTPHTSELYPSTIHLDRSIQDHALPVSRHAVTLWARDSQLS